MSNIVGFDLGTGSIGTAVRNTSLGDDIKEQLEYYSVDIFDSGVGNDKSGEYSYAAARSKSIRQRRLYDVRRRRRWETLKYLIKAGYCPLSMDDLKEWKTYNKSKGLSRKYPINNKEFMSWIRLDFDGDGKTDCTPYKLRHDLVHRQFDFNNQTERYRLGRAIYHICQHRGFRSSKGETLSEQNENPDVDLVKEMKLSELKKSGKLSAFMEVNKCKTAGEALYLLEQSGLRIRNSEFQAVRSQLKDEISRIFEYQNGLDIQSDFYKHLISEDKYVGCIFYKNPLRSQKGLVGHCTMEPSKPRCPISHPNYEKYRAWCFIANIKVRKSSSDDWSTLDVGVKQYVYDTCYLSFVSADFEFKRIRDVLEKKLGFSLIYKPNKKGNINYSDKQNVAGCPVSARLKRLLGNDWESMVLLGTKERNSHSKKNPQRHIVSYSAEDIWHYCFTCDDKEYIEQFGRKTLMFNEDKIKQLLNLWASIKQGYSMLSRKAIRNITRMLLYGFENKDAILLAKIPEIIGLSKWERNENDVRDILSLYNKKLIKDYNHERILCNITNALIANYKALREQHVFAYKDVNYQLDDSDFKDVDYAIVDYFGENTWAQMSAEEQTPIIEEIRCRYQKFFSSSKREFYKNKTLADYFGDFMSNHIPNFNQTLLKKLYHPSMAEFPIEKKGKNESDEYRLGSPKLGGIKNPVALRTLHILRNKVNAMLDEHIIDPETTRVVIETTRDINDANMRWAIKQYQEKRHEENKVIENLLKEFFPDGKISDENYDKANCFMYQGCCNDRNEIEDEYLYGDNMLFPFTGNKDKIAADKQRLILKYNLWKQQGGICIYTGKIISFGSLFDENKYDIEHTLPRSKSFDDSQANLTVCDYYYNRSIKGNKLPTELANYEEDAVIYGVKYTAIKPRLRAWEKKVEKLKEHVEFWKAQSRKAQDKSRKDDCIRQKHLWQMELEFWEEKLMHFKMVEISQNFRHRQLRDTGTISRYAVLYLKTIFHNVEVQKGEVTGVFRKILGLQNLEEKKDRSLHSHHAIDAVVLTMIPNAAKREKMLKMFYEKKEAIKDSHDYKRLSNELELEVKSCHLGNHPETIADFINRHILINKINREKVLIPSCKKWRVRGKEVLFKQKDGSCHPRIKQGDSIRGSLHQDTIYGAILYPITDKVTNKPITENGHFVYDKNNSPKMVSRIPVKKLTNLESLDSIVDYSLREDIKKQIERRIKEGKTFNTARDEGLWLLDKNGVEIKKSKKGKVINSIRHIRCFVKAGRGFLTYEKALQLKSHIHQSEKQLVNITNRDHRNKIYVINEENCLMLLYATVIRGKLKRAARILNVWEVAKLRKSNSGLRLLSDIAKEPYFNTYRKGYDEYAYYASLQPGTRVLKWENNYEELYEMTADDLTKRLYYVKKFNNTGTTDKPSYRIYLQSHIEAEENLKSYSPRDFDFLIEGADFNINMLGQIIFKEHL